ncbi:hypothetical protein GF337_12460 [candidate division KSB1 bacterium]|nr:hypothetical protein [candidate division KSB1 bacterium]
MKRLLERFQRILFLLILMISGFSYNGFSATIEFSGNSRMQAQISNRQGRFQRIPSDFWRWEVNSRLSVYDVPFGVRFFLSSEQSGVRQNMNRFSISLLSNRLTKRIPFLSHFNKLCIGTCNPYYSSLTLSGSAMNGVDIEINPGLFYLAFTTGSSRKSIYTRDLQNATYSRRILAGKIGIGKKRSSHLYFAFMRAWDDASSLVVDTSLVTPKENYLAGAEAHLVLFRKKLEIQGEFVASMLTRDVRSATIDQEEVEQVPEWLFDLIDPRISSSVDYAYRVKSLLNLSKTKLSAEVRMVGPGYYSLAAPYLRNDELLYEFRFDQALYQRNIYLSSYYRRSEDNLIPWKRTSTITSAFGFNVSLRFPKYPYVQVNYAPFYQDNDHPVDSLKTENKTSLMSLVTGYNYRVGSINATTNFFISEQQSELIFESGTRALRTFSINQNMQFRFPMSLSLSFSHVQTDYSGDITTLDMNSSYRFLNMWSNMLGIRITSHEQRGHKTGFYIVSKFPAWKFGDLHLRADQNFFRQDMATIGEYDEFILRVILTKRW